MDIIELTDNTFAELVTGADQPVLVEFSARWCGACKMLAPVLHDLATEQADHLRVAQIDVDENPETTARFGVMSMPTLILLVEGREAMRLVGARGKANLVQEIAAHLPSRVEG